LGRRQDIEARTKYMSHQTILAHFAVDRHETAATLNNE